MSSTDDVGLRNPSACEGESSANAMDAYTGLGNSPTFQLVGGTRCHSISKNPQRQQSQPDDARRPGQTTFNLTSTHGLAHLVDTAKGRKVDGLAPHHTRGTYAGGVFPGSGVDDRVHKHLANTPSQQVAVSGYCLRVYGWFTSQFWRFPCWTQCNQSQIRPKILVYVQRDTHIQPKSQTRLTNI